MKYSPLLPQVALVFAVAYACTDSTAPANSHALLTPRNPTPDVLGDPPPPPVDAAMNVCVGSAGCAAYDGTYFSNGETLASIVAAGEVGELSLTFDGTAWLKFDNAQPSPEGTASANARFKRQDDKLSGMGTLVINGSVVVITAVLDFIPFEACGQQGDVCAEIIFEATVDGVPNQTGNATAQNSEGCILFTGEGSSYFCPPEGS